MTASPPGGRGPVRDLSVGAPRPIALAQAFLRRAMLPRAFDPDGYLARYPDARGACGGPGLHWLRHGRHEGRLPVALAAAAAEARLWAGEDAAAGELAALAQAPAAAGHRRAEAVWARLALARALVAGIAVPGRGPEAGPGAAALDWIAPVDPLQDVVCLLGMPGPLLLMAEIARAGLPGPQGCARAGGLLALARAAFGPHPAWRILQASLALAGADGAGPADGAAFQRRLAPLYAGAGLAAPALIPAGNLPLFDRLTARPGPPVAQGPLVSVLMPARAAAATIDTALGSLAAQGWRAIEVLVLVNAAPGDTTALRAAAWAARDPRIRVVDTGDDPGAYPARNRGLALAAGEFVTCQDADDWSHPDRIARQVAVLQAAPGLAAVLPFWVRMDEGLRPSGLRPDIGLIHPSLSGLMIRRTAMERAGFWDRVRAGADTEYAERLRHLFGPGAIGHLLPDVPLAFGRVHAASLTQGAATGLTGPGAAARAAYLAAARVWHQSGADLCLPARPARRPFAIPAALARPDPAPDPEAGP